MKQRNQTIDICRGIAAVCMIVGHSIITYPVDISTTTWCVYLHRVIFLFHMELFFFLAGVVYRCGDYKSYMIKKCKRILIPYFAFGILSLIMKAFGGSLVNRGTSLGQGFVDLLFYGGNYWFLYTLFIIFAFYPFIDKKLGLKGKIVILVACVVWRYLAIYIFKIEFAIPFRISSICEKLPFFIAGDIIAKNARLITKIKERSIPIIISGIFAFLIPFVFHMDERAGFDILFRYIEGAAIIASLYLLIGLFEKKKEKHTCVSKGFSYCGQISLQMYLFNGYLMTLIRYVICNMFKITDPLIIICGISSFCIIVTVLVCRWIAPKVKPIRVLIGM